MEILHTLILITHVLCAAIIIGIAFVTMIIELKNFTAKETLILTELIWKVAGPLLGIQLLTGFYLTATGWDKIQILPSFWIKMFLFFVIGTFVGIVNKRHFKSLKEGKSQPNMTNWSAISFLTFTAIAALGVMIAESA